MSHLVITIVMSKKSRMVKISDFHMANSANENPQGKEVESAETDITINKSPLIEKEHIKSCEGDRRLSRT